MAAWTPIMGLQLQPLASIGCDVQPALPMRCSFSIFEFSFSCPEIPGLLYCSHRCILLLHCCDCLLSLIPLFTLVLLQFENLSNVFLNFMN